MKNKMFSFVLAVFLIISCVPWTSLSANSLHVMSNPGTAVIPADFSSNRQNAVDSIRSTLDSGNNPQSAITTAQNKLVESYNNNRSSGIQTEYWIFVISDGEFNEQGVFGKAELDTAFQSFSQAQITDGMDLHTIYLAIGSNAIEAASEPGFNIIARKCDDGKAIVSVLSELSNAVSGRYSISKDYITFIDDKTVQVVTEISLMNIAILMQNSSAALDSIVSDGGTTLSVVQQVSLKYPEKAGWTSDTNLNGKAFLLENAGQSITSVNLFKDIITLIWPIFILAYLVFYLTKRRFSKSFITRKIYFIAESDIREGSKSQVFVKPSTGWRQFFSHTCTQKFAYLIFTAARNREVSVRYLLQKPIDYLVASLTDNLEEIAEIFTCESWKTGTHLDKNIRISESTALYIRTKTNISVYYIRKWHKRANKRSKSDAAASNNDDDVMYMYEQGDNIAGYDSVADLRRDAEGIVTGMVLSAKPIFRSNILHTLSEVSVETVYSGPFTKGDVIYIEEHGGQVTMEDYIKGTELENEAVEEIETSTEKTAVVVGIDGYYPMPLGRYVLLFLQDSGLKTDELERSIFACLGGYNGIFYQQNDKYTYVNPKPDASGIHASLEVLCANGGRMSVTAGELYKKKK